MPRWDDVVRLAGVMPGAVAGAAHEGSPAFYAGRHQFARLRWDDDGREILQFWSGDMDLAAQLTGREDTFCRVDVFEYRVSVWAYLDRLGSREMAEFLLDSFRIRGGVRRAATLDEEAYFGSL